MGVSIILSYIRSLEIKLTILFLHLRIKDGKTFSKRVSANDEKRSLHRMRFLCYILYKNMVYKNIRLEFQLKVIF